MSICGILFYRVNTMDDFYKEARQQTKEKLKQMKKAIIENAIKQQENKKMSFVYGKFESSESTTKIKEYKRNEEEENQLGKETAARFDQGKLRYDLIPPYPLDELVKVYTFGTVKYSPDNYLKGMPWRRVIGPALRHLYKWLRGEKYDPESGIHHLAHCVWNLFTLMVYEKYEISVDDRNPYLLDLLPEEKQKEKIEQWNKTIKNKE